MTKTETTTKSSINLTKQWLEDWILSAGQSEFKQWLLNWIKDNKETPTLLKKV